MNARRYVRISSEEFEEFITGIVPAAKKVDAQNTTEDVWELPLPDDTLCIRVYSTIQGREARDRGDDAIRCVLWSREEECPVGGRKKTLRISTWRDNLEPKIRDLYLNWRDHDYGRCPACDTGLLVERTPSGSQSWDPFLACSNWNGGDGCEYTQSLR